MLKLPIILVTFVALFLVNAKKSEALNLYELSLIGIGFGFVANQYFDKTLESSNNFELKGEVVDKFYNSKQKIIPSKYFRSLPIQEQLLIIEELESF